MSLVVQRRILELPPVDQREVLRYAQASGLDEQALLERLKEVCQEAAPLIAGRVCFVESPLRLSGDEVSFEGLSVRSANLGKALDGCASAVLFGATIGLGLDRLIAKYGRISPLKALFCQALGAERIEALCDGFCAQLAREKLPQGLRPRPRFSPGYGDCPLDFQKSLFQILDAPHQIGLSLNGSLLMSPTKSVTAIVGVEKLETSR